MLQFLYELITLFIPEGNSGLEILHVDHLFFFPTDSLLRLSGAVPITLPCPF